MSGYRVLFLGTAEQVGSAVIGKDGVMIPKPVIQARVELASKAMREWPRA